MSDIFISYSRVDIKFVVALAEKLRRIYGHENVWFDEGLHGGDIWWEEILEQIKTRDIFIYVLSNDSVQSDYCKAEFAEARRLQKQIITIQARDRTRLTEKLGDIHYINMANGVDDADAITDLYRSVNKRMTKVPKRTPKPLWEPVTPRPDKVDEKTRSDDSPDVETPILELPRAEREKSVEYSVNSKLNRSIRITKALLVLIAAIILVGVIQYIRDNSQPQTVAATQEAAQIETSPITNTESDRPTPEPTDTLTDTEPNIVQEAETLIAEFTAQKLISDATSTSVEKTAIFNQTLTQEAIETATATVWTKTPTPDYTASVSALLTEWAGGTATQQSINATITATLWTATPTPTPDPLTQAMQRAQAGVSSNAEWEAWYPEGFVQEFDGIEMVLVPKGCFMMGSDDGDDDEQPVHEQCIENPFWIDQYEVTNEQYGSTGCEASSSNPRQPRNCVDWFEAKAHCETRDGRLPTEKEWEYAARGPDNLVYPWGNDYIFRNVIGADYLNGLLIENTFTVGNRIEGISWVGALDMSGNVIEWTSSLTGNYPYSIVQEDISLSRQRVLRGGSFISDEYSLRSAFRVQVTPGFNFSSVGLRCARDG